MAEAHSAVAFSFVVTHEGLNVNVNREAIKAVIKSGLKSYKKKFTRIKNRIHNGIYPVGPYSWLGVIILLFSASMMNRDLSFGVINHLTTLFNTYLSIQPVYDHLCAALLFSMTIWLLGIQACKSIISLLLSYTYWMYEPRGTMTNTTKIWLLLTKVFLRAKPKLYSYQGSLPKLPLPSINDTITKYLLSVRCLLNDSEYKRIENLAHTFQKTVANRLQFYLKLKSWWSSNYVSDWWEDYVYLHGRTPIMINSNFYGLDLILMKLTSVQSARAANFTYSLIQFRRLIEREIIPPAIITHNVPLCSWQFERTFNTCRIPGRDKDIVQHVDDSNHIAVLSRGRYYKCYIYYNGRHLQPFELQQIFQKILDDPSEPAPGEAKLAALTAGDREPWATTRSKYFAHGLNKNSLDIIEKAAFMVVLDDEDHFYDAEDPYKLINYARAALHGNGCNRWFDKSFNVIVSKNGMVSFNVEHSWADAPVLAYAMEYTMQNDIALGYNSEGNCVRGNGANDKPKRIVPNPIRLQWDLDKECQAVMGTSLATAQQLIDDLDLFILPHLQFGKRVFKNKAKCSPDAFIQIALQLAYNRDSKKFCLTYEAAMTRLFREGRTETIRSANADSCAFVRAFEDTNVSKKEKISLLHKAAEAHHKLARDAMTGQGVDRHLFCLYVLSKYLGADSPFLKEVLSEPWRLSTSQVAHEQTGKVDLNKNPTHICAGGGFGPVCDDGYGVSYLFAGEDALFFHVSSKSSCPTTNSKRFAETIVTAVHNMMELFE